MTKVSLLKIGENEYRQDGFVDYTTGDIKTVTVEGETYSKTIYKEQILDLTKDFENKTEYQVDGVTVKDRWHRWDLDFLAQFGLTNLQIWGYRFVSGGLWPEIIGWAESNESIRILRYLHKENIIDNKKIKNIFSSKWAFSIEDRLFEENELIIDAFTPGECSWVSVSMDIRKFYELDFSLFDEKTKKHLKYNYYDRYPAIFPEKLLNKPLNDYEKAKLIVKFFEYKISSHVTV